MNQENNNNSTKGNDNHLILYIIIVIVFLLIINYVSNFSCSYNEKFEQPSQSTDSTTTTTETNSETKPVIPLPPALKIDNNISDILINSKFKLRVLIPDMPSYVKGVNDENKNDKNNWFYLSVENLNPNCKVKSISGTCMDIYVDDKKCDSKILTNYVQNNPYRLILISSTYANDKALSFGKNTTFTIDNISGKQYLKNVETGCILSLFNNTITQNVHGNIINDNTSNIKTIVPYTNELCLATVPASVPKPNTTIINTTRVPLEPEKFTAITGTPESQKTTFISCEINSDKNTYLITSKDLSTSSPILIEYNSDNTISLQISQFNSYGNLDKSYYLSICDYNVKTLKDIETLTHSTGTFFVNMVCIKKHEKSKLKMEVEMIEYSNEYLKNQYIHSV